MNLRRFKKEGLEKFKDYHDRLRDTPTLNPPTELLEDRKHTEPVSQDSEVEQRHFDTRLEAGLYLNDLIERAQVRSPERDQGLWAWLTLFYFDEVCPRDAAGRRKVGETARLIPELDSHRKYYRHLLLGPFLIVRAHRDNPERAMALLCGRLDKPGDVAEQLCSRQELVTNRGVIELATRLYYDGETKQLKRGAGGKGPGSPRRLAQLLNQLDLTYYLYTMTADELEALLPDEFRRFREVGANQCHPGGKRPDFA